MMATGSIWTIPNQLTVARFFLSLGLFALIAWEQWTWALVVYLVAAFTDWLDGYIARVWDMGSDLGRILDPLVDKVLNLGAFVFLLPVGTSQGWLLPWMVTLLVVRELVITGLRSELEARGAKFGADWLGKLKMVLQCVALAVILLAMQLPGLALTRDVLVWAVLVVTLLSGLQYLVKAARIATPKTE
jgi:CDP-diacylglycerol---glycerol-3-phosphate 3-phosphatidyltransferase